MVSDTLFPSTLSPSFLQFLSIFIKILITTLTGIISFFVFIVKTGRNAILEKYYKKSIRDGLKRFDYFSIFGKDTPSEIVVESPQKFSTIRALVKKFILGVLFKRKIQHIFVFQKKTPEEQKAFVIQKAFESVTQIDLLDMKFLESLIYYLAYKYAYDFGNIEQPVKNILRRDFESCPYRELINKLDSLEFGAKIVLNPPPQEKSLLTNVLLPMVVEWEKSIIAERKKEAKREEIEKYKSFAMKMIQEIGDEKYAVVFIGLSDISKYIQMVRDCIDRTDGFIIAARGNYILKASAMITRLFDFCQGKNLQISAYPILGKWEQRRRNPIDCAWYIFAKTEIFPEMKTFVAETRVFPEMQGFVEEKE